jgi:hypothetical protein
MNPESAQPTHAEDRAAFRRTLVRVLVMQAIALIALWLLQARYNP